MTVIKSYRFFINPLKIRYLCDRYRRQAYPRHPDGVGRAAALRDYNILSKR